MNNVYLIEWPDSYTEDIFSKDLYNSHDEKQYVKRFKKNNDRVAHLLSRSYVRKFSAEILGIPPMPLSIATTSYGRPFLSDYKSELDFNISHSGNIVAITISNDGLTGIDIEKIQSIDFNEINIFTPEELNYIGLDKDIDSRRFFLVWTAIEAYSKMLGMGLSEQLKNRIFMPLGGQKISYKCNGKDAIVHLNESGKKYMLAVATNKHNTSISIKHISLN